MKLGKFFASGLIALSLAAAAVLVAPRSTRAADHGDAPALAQDLGADINDVFFFLDPTDITQSQTVMIATIHGFLVPGEVPNFAVFDENIKYRFQIYNEHVNFVSPVLDPAAPAARKANFIKSIKVARSIDVTFSKRQVGPHEQIGTGGGAIPQNLRRPLQQQITVTFNGFSGLKTKTFKADATGDPLLVTPFNLANPPAPNFNVQSLKLTTSATAQVFAGEVDDPFFFDIPAFNSFLDGIRNGGGPNVGAFSRQRDTFGGYNTLAIAIRIPTSFLLGSDGLFLGLDFVTQRHATQLVTNQGVKGVGAFKTIDRMGNPTVNVALIPFDVKNAYNGGTPKGDASGQFAGFITTTLNQLGVDSSTPEPAFVALGNIAVAYGDILQLDTSISNLNSPAGAGYDHKDGSGFALPNGRRLQDDTVDIILSTINHNMTVSDGVANSGALSPSFPFLGKPNQPLANGSTDPTRN